MRNENQFHQLFHFSVIPESRLISKTKTGRSQRATESPQVRTVLTVCEQRRAAAQRHEDPRGAWLLEGALRHAPCPPPRTRPTTAFPVLKAMC